MTALHSDYDTRDNQVVIPTVVAAIRTIRLILELSVSVVPLPTGTGFPSKGCVCGGGGGLAGTASLRVGTQNKTTDPRFCATTNLSPCHSLAGLQPPVFKVSKGSLLLLLLLPWLALSGHQFNSIQFIFIHSLILRQRKHLIFTCKGNISFSLAKETYHFHLQRKHIIFTCPDTIILITVAKTLIIRGEKKVLQFRSQSGP